MPKFPALTTLIIVVILKVFINPTIKVLDYQKINEREGCESIRGFVAEVPRYKQIEISGNFYTFKSHRCKGNNIHGLGAETII